MGKVSNGFDVEMGVKQCNCLLPLLFNEVLNRTIKQVAEMNTGNSIRRKINMLAYADDIVFIVKNTEEQKTMLQVLLDEANKVCLLVNVDKIYEYNQVHGE